MDIAKKDAKIIAGLKLTVDLANIFLGIKPGTEEEIKKLNEIKETLGDKIYNEVIYLFTNTSIEESEKAKELIKNIRHHESILKKLLGREVGIQVAALDYMQNRANIIIDPTFIERKRIKKLAVKAITDDYIQVYDKAMFFSNLEDEMARAGRYGSGFSITMLDIDDFKKINDSYGHVIGDKVLKKVAATVKNNIRRTDSVYRFGGDEFIVLLPETALHDTEKTAVKILKLCKKIKIQGGKISINVSMGISTFGRVNDRDIKQILSDVDKALYEAKRAGKNKIFKNTTGGFEEVYIDKINFDKASKQNNKRFVLSGVPISPGISAGKVFHYRDILSREVDLNNIKEDEIDWELSRIYKAINKVQKDLIKMQKRVKNDLNSGHAAIFKAQRIILQDDTLMHEIESELKKRMINAEHIVKYIFNRWEKRFKTSYAASIKDKSYDIADIGRWVFLALQGLEADVLANIPQDSVIFAKRLLTSDTVHLNKKMTRAVVTEEGSRNAHSALLARAMNIPAVVKIKTKEYEIPNGTTVLVNGDKGDVIVNPSRKELDLEKNKRSTTKKHRRKGYYTEDIKIKGKHIKVYSNIASPKDARTAKLSGCDGIGLFRIEQIYMASNILPDTDYLMSQLLKSLKYMKNKVTTVRLLDIGKDKTLPYLHINDEQNSILGLRGIRLLLRYPGLLETQIAALLKLSNQYSVQILVPMVSLPEEMVEVRKVLENEKKKLKKNSVKYKSDIQLGAMIETPSSVITIDEIIENSDFLSIGTNDLIQYTMAADREKLTVSEYYDVGIEIVLESIKVILEKAMKKGLYCGICGELAGNLDYTEKLIELGLRNFSVSPNIVRSVKEKLIDISKNILL